MERAPLPSPPTVTPAAPDDQAMLDAAQLKRPREGAPSTHVRTRLYVRLEGRRGATQLHSGEPVSLPARPSAFATRLQFSLMYSLPFSFSENTGMLSVSNFSA
eukprot:scaffold141802_cov33-Tisochrysis_lutea.AAC.7